MRSIQLPEVFKRQDVQWCRFRWSIPFSIDYVGSVCTERLSRLFHSHIVYEIAIAKITAEFTRISQCSAWFDTVEINRLSFPSDKMCDDNVFADRYRYQLTKFEILVLARLSRFLHAHIACEIDGAQFTARIWRLFHYYAWFDTVEFNRLSSPNDKIYDDDIFAVRFRYQWTMFGKNAYIDSVISTPSWPYCIWNSIIKYHYS